MTARIDDFPGIDTKAIDGLISRGASPGCAAVVSSPEDRFEFSSGAYSDTDRRPVGPHTLYDAASITKLFTTALVLRLFDENRTGPESRMGEYLPHFKNSALTVRDLLTHRARMVCEPLSKMALETPDIRALAERVPVSPAASPHFFYQNATFLFLGIMVEELRGKAFADCLLEMISELGLRETRVGSEDGLDAPPTEIRGGNAWANKTHDESSYLCGGVTGYAGIFASAGDLVKFGRAWLDFKIASPETTGKAFTNYGGYPGEEQGLGWLNTLPRFPALSRDVFCHSGYTGPILAVNPKKDKVYALCCNRAYYGRDNQLYRELWARVLASELIRV
ncbi:MAG: beta-lactamase family protein [Synergistaceae bacterium]|jgi:CubicO group peptidase (beta-lactamase class C family)|nr:beta-lactamase family protein [Synergistaceae bacterium]